MSTHSSAWLAWSLCALSLLLSAASIVLYVATRSVQPPSNWGTGGDSAVLIVILPFVTFPLVGALIAFKRPKNPVGWICLAVGIIWMIMPISSSYGIYGLVVRPGSVPFEKVASPCLALRSGDRLGERRLRPQPRADGRPRGGTQPVRAREVSLASGRDAR